MSADISVGGCSEADGSSDSIDGMGGCVWNAEVIWNGRTIELIIEAQKKQQKALDIIRADMFRKTIELRDLDIQQIALEEEDEDEKALEDVLAVNNDQYKFGIEGFETEHGIHKSLTGHLKRLGKEIHKGLHKMTKAMEKAAKKAAKAAKKSFKTVAHGTKKAEKKVEHFVKKNKKEILITLAVLTAIAGALALSGTFGASAAAVGGAAASGATASGGPKKREDEEGGKGPSPSSSPSNPPPLPDWVSELLKSTAPGFSFDSCSENTISSAREEAHAA